MKIAIFHDYIGAIGGGEKLVLTLARGLGADVITTDVDEDSVRKMGFEDVKIISLGRMIKLAPIKQICASLRFALCNFSGNYDFFIFSGNWAHFAAKKHKPNMWYCFTPTRIFYDLHDVFIGRVTFIFRPLFKIWITLHEPISKYYSGHIQHIVTISRNVQGRIKKYYGRDSIVVFPAIDVSRCRFKKYGDFWLSVNRLYPEKRIELQINAFRQMPDEKLVIVGGYATGDHASKYASWIKRDLPENVELIGSITEEELLELYATCKGHITTAIDEDFGMTPVEAMASGKPTIAVREGGYLETIIDGETGILVDANKNEIMQAVKLISHNPEKYKNASMKRARDFDTSEFIKQISTVIQSFQNNNVK
ncbi:MAG: glycosyltransferase [Candidatus Methanoperedens sp.]|nr:glycosyltransferase [Candidatus Methanoperedens sp.]